MREEGVRVLEVLFDGDRAVGVKIRDEQNNDREVFAKVVVDASGQTAMLQNRFKLRLWDPVLNKGAIWTYWENAYRDSGKRRGRDAGDSDRRQAGLVLVHPAARQHRQRRRRRAVRAPVQQGPREPREDLRGRSRERARREAAACESEARHRLFRHEGLFVSREAGGWQRLGAGRRRVRIPRSAVFVRRAAGVEVGAARRRRDRRWSCEG